MKFKTIKQIYDNSIRSIENNNVIMNLSIILLSAVVSFAIFFLFREKRWEHFMDLLSALFTLSLSVLFIFIREYRAQYKKQKKEDYFKVINSIDFKEFTNDVMENYYGKEYLTTLNYNGKDTDLNNYKIPVYCLLASEKIRHASSINGFDELFDKPCIPKIDKSEKSNFDIKDHQNYDKYYLDKIKKNYYRDYKDIVGDKIEYPDRPGFMFDEVTTGNGMIDKISVHVGTFAENTYSSHVLEYELYQAYLVFNKKWKEIRKELKNKKEDNSDEFWGKVNKFWNEVNERLEIRNLITKECGGKTESLLCGKGRHALLSVQMLVVIKSKSGEYEVKMIQRSQNVSIAPGEYQFVPCGYFEIFNDSDDGCYNEDELKENLSPGYAVFREYLEELFQEKDFEGGGIGSVSDRIPKDRRISKISEMLDNKKASLIFLGSALNLRILCHFLSFALIIEEDSYTENQFIGNEEVRKGIIFSRSINRLNNYENWEKMNACSTALWYLFTKTKEYEDIIKRSKQ